MRKPIAGMGEYGLAVLTSGMVLAALALSGMTGCQMDVVPINMSPPPPDTPPSTATATFQTSGVFRCANPASVTAGCDTASVTMGTIQLAFVGTTSRTVNATTGTTSLGRILAACTAGGSGCARTDLTLAGLRLTITVNQTAPLAFSGALNGDGALAGAIGGADSSAQIQWPVGPDLPSIVLGLNTYAIYSNAPLAIPAPAANNCTVGCLQPGATGELSLLGNIYLQ